MEQTKPSRHEGDRRDGFVSDVGGSARGDPDRSTISAKAGDEALAEDGAGRAVAGDVRFAAA